jgi:hypothetical protein
MNVVDVLETMDHAIRCVRGVDREACQRHKRLTEARAAMAELLEAADSYEKSVGRKPQHVVNAKLARMRAAIYRCKGEGA